jgi:hypothetical protein
MGEQDDRDISAVIRAKLADGRLLNSSPSTMSTGNGHANICDVCGERIRAVEIECEVTFASAPGLFRFHRKCFDVWQDERSTISHGGTARRA